MFCCTRTPFASAAMDKRSPRRNTLPIAVCAIASVIISAFIGTRFFFKKRQQNPSSGRNSENISPETDGSSTDPSSSSSDGTEMGREFEVFLSFRGTDIRKTFTDYLYHSLIDAGVCTFRDNEELHVGEEICPNLMNSIKQSKIGIPIFSADYASSKWCLMEVAEMVKCMKESKQLIMPIFLDITPDDVQHQTGTYANSFSQHEERFGQEKVQAWRDALKEVVELKGLELDKVANGN
ncbi:TMV resistance protein N-like isoform X2 [Punica granatum]|uniref:ADP-ribosyl cyclase/cyclic ADP-ribose hydrolase n=1 Tax=Punica granatum TaxID=22663 RepID=A0A6P8C736_PUNGR|nr:TMV resistance protein N-like isoform X2 [Punica granatum]XP_031379378.1 TMV resistance protein N-like isoform X2 [Punica granatum]XP_031379379.1 TMV resistance protein N-like isoform X2 [Punica granatum]